MIAAKVPLRLIEEIKMAIRGLETAAREINGAGNSREVIATEIGRLSRALMDQIQKMVVNLMSKIENIPRVKEKTAIEENLQEGQITAEMSAVALIDP